MSLKEQEILQEFADSKAILKGHFILSSGLHSDTYMQCARVLMNPKRAEKLCSALAEKVEERLGKNFFDIVVAPAMGGVVVGYEMGRQLGLETIFCERVNGIFELRRGFELPKESRVLVVEDVITTGKSSLETYALVEKFGAKVVAECSLVDRSNDRNLEQKMKVPVISLLQIEVQTFDENNVPENLKDIPAVKPGSRFIQK
ncbi:MAG: orotate phosphoribosyltransferase [Pelagibacterales bacterium]|nr:orotate phosphoribosyltransferase [Pelagibacterales bacterium]